MELESFISQYLIWFAILVDAMLQQLNRAFTRWAMMDLAAGNGSAVIVQVAYHPLILLSHFEVCLP